MTTITTKFSIGDTVYRAATITKTKQHPCPDCLGSKKWKAISPDGGEYEFSCPRCGGGYLSHYDISLDYTVHEATVYRMTIGSVRMDTQQDEPGYMCVETGIGSGASYKESDFWFDKDDAFLAANILAAERNRDTKWIVEKFDATLEISDYKLEHAMIHKAGEIRRHWQRKLEILFEELDDPDNTAAQMRKAVKVFKDGSD